MSGCELDVMRNGLEPLEMSGGRPVVALIKDNQIIFRSIEYHKAFNNRLTIPIFDLMVEMSSSENKVVVRNEYWFYEVDFYKYCKLERCWQSLEYKQTGFNFEVL